MPEAGQSERLRGRVAVVTGGGSGIGRAVVDRFVAEGAALVVLELSEARAQALRDSCPEQVVVIVGDATRLEDNVAAVRAAVDTFGHLDSFVANTGYWDFGTTLVDLPDDARFDLAFQQLFDLNVKAFLAGAKSAHEALRATGGAWS